jgi:outer membrane protein assembly factor BamB
LTRAFAAGLATLAVAASGCGSGASIGPVFSDTWQNDRGESIGRVQSQIGAAAMPEQTPIALGVTSVGITGVPLDGSPSWRQRLDLVARPIAAGTVVVAAERTTLSAFDARSGRRLWQMGNEGRQLVGAGDDGQLTLLNLSSRAGRALLLAVNREGSVVRRLEPVAPHLGEPAVVAGVAFVPWGQQYVSAIDLRSGEELARLLARDQLTRALVLDGQLYFGERVLLRFDDRIDDAWQNKATRLALPERKLPGDPRWFTVGTAVESPFASARDKVQLLATPAAGGTPANGNFAATYFRLAMGFEAKDAALRWVRGFPSDLIGGAAARSGFVFCDGNGKIWLLDGLGRVSKTLEMDQRLQSCVVQASGVTIPAGEPAGALTAQLQQVLSRRDHELAAAQRLLLADLAKLADSQATAVLIQLASDATTTPEILREATALLAMRRTGAEHMLAALERHYDFLDDVLLTPPIAALADALAAMNETRAAPLLAEHLNDPANPPTAVEHAARALEKLASPGEAEALKTFFALYRSSAEQKSMIEAVISTGRALLRVGGEEGRRIVEVAAADPLTHPDVQKGLAGVVSQATATRRVTNSSG